MPSRIELLQAMPVFGGLREETLSFLLDLSNMVSVAAGGYFFRQDDEAEAMYVLEAGRASVLKGWKGHQYVLSHLGQGDCFGEMSLMDMHHRSASVVADEACEAIELTSGSLHAIYQRDLEQFTLIQMNMGREVSRRLRDADERLFHAKIRSAEVLAEYRFRTI